MVLKLKVWTLLIITFLLINFSQVKAQDLNHLSRKTREYLVHDSQMAEKLFKEKCTSCYSSNTALSRRAYQDWRLGITKRHGQSPNWLSDQEARTIFFILLSI